MVGMEQGLEKTKLGRLLLVRLWPWYWLGPQKVRQGIGRTEFWGIPTLGWDTRLSQVHWFQERKLLLVP